MQNISETKPLKKLIKKDSRIARIELYGGLLWIIFCFICFFTSLNIVRFNLEAIYGWLFIVGPILGFYVFSSVIRIPDDLIKNTSQVGDEIDNLYKQIGDGKTQFSIDSILFLTQRLHQYLLEFIKKRGLLRLMLSINGNREIEKYFQEKVKRILSMLLLLKKNLKNKLSESIIEVKGANSNLLHLKKGENSLVALTELQSTRLDHQIKQFEELQKVLVKI